MHTPHIIERAFQLAPEVSSVDEIRKALRQEGYANVDAHLARIAPRLRIDVADGSVDLAFASMDDFHPDRLVARLSALAAHPPTTPEPQPSASVIDVARDQTMNKGSDPNRLVSGTSLLDDMLDDVIPHPRRADELSAFVERAVAPHLVRPPDHATVVQEEAKQNQTVKLLRQVLHHARVQVWRDHRRR